MRCDHLVRIWWQLVLIWPQIGRICVLGDFRAHCSTTRRQSGVYQETVRLSGSSPGKFFSMYYFASAQARIVRHSDTDSTPLLRNLGQNCFTLSVFGVLAGGQSGADRGQSTLGPWTFWPCAVFSVSRRSIEGLAWLFLEGPAVSLSHRHRHLAT